MNKQDVKETIIYFIGTVLVSILGFIMSVLYSKMFKPYDYGVYSLVYSLYNLLLNIYAGWISLSIIRNAKVYKNKNQSNELFSSFFLLHIIMSFAFFVIVNGVTSFLNLNTLYKELMFIFSLIYFFEEELLIINTYLRSEGNAKQYSLNTSINSFLKVAFLILIFFIIKCKNVTAIAYSLLLSEIVQCIYLYKKLKLSQFYKTKKVNFEIIKSMFIYGMPLIGVSVTNWILNVSDRYIIRFFYSESEVGLYSYAYTLGNSIFNLLTSFIMLGAYPKIVKAWEDEGKESAINVIKKYLTVYFLIIIPAILGACFISKDFFYLFTEKSYQSGYGVFNITCIAISILGLSNYINKTWELNSNTKMIFILYVLTAVLNIILNFTMIPKYGYWVAALTTLISCSFYLVMAFILSRKTLKITIEFKKLFYICLSSLTMIAFMKLFILLVSKITLLTFIAQILIGIITYFLAIMFFKIIDIKDIMDFFKLRK